jgi:uncharacterized membrane-anchored protein
MIYNKLSIKSDNNFVYVYTEPVDPRSLFRGDYVILRYKNITNIPKEKFKTKQTDSKQKYLNVYTVLKPESENSKTYILDYADLNKPVKNKVFFKGKFLNSYNRFNRNKSINAIKYGIEQFFVPENQGKKIENLIRDRNTNNKVKIKIYYDKNGRTLVDSIYFKEQKIEFE